MGKLENLVNATWISKSPLIVAASDAYELVPQDHRFYMVTWWGNEPAGFSLFEFTGVVSGGYEIKITDESGETIEVLESDEWVLLFIK